MTNSENITIKVDPEFLIPSSSSQILSNPYHKTLKSVPTVPTVKPRRYSTKGCRKLVLSAKPKKRKVPPNVIKSLRLRQEHAIRVKEFQKRLEIALDQQCSSHDDIGDVHIIKEESDTVEMIEELPLECPPEEQQITNKWRVANLKTIMSILQLMAKHSPQCSLSDVVVEEEDSDRKTSKIYLVCKKCDIKIDADFGENIDTEIFNVCS